MSSSKPALELKGVCKQYGQTVVLAELDLSVFEGEAYYLCGANGAGKTTVHKMVAGLLRADSGLVFRLGVRLPDSDRRCRREFAYLGAEALLYERLTVLEHIAYVGALWGRTSSACKSKAEDLLDLFGLWAHKDIYIAELSRGSRQKVGIISTLVTGPKLLLLDEPFNTLDSATVKVAIRCFRDIVQQGGSILLTTHNVEEGRMLAHRAGVLSGGRISAEGPLSDILPCAGRTQIPAAT